MTHLSLRLLGTVQLVAAGTLSTPQAGRVSTLLALLATEAGRVVSLDRLMHQLWSDEPPRSGVATLHVYVSRLRRHLDGTGIRIVTRAPGYVLEAAEGAIDTRVFTSLAARAESDAAAAAWPAVLAATDEARALWRGDPFIDTVPCSDLDGEGQRLRELSLRVDEVAARALLALGRSSDAEALATALTRRDPLNERYWRLAMRAAHADGRDALALSRFDEYSTTLAEALGIDPSERMRALHLEILRGSGEAGATPAAVGAGVASPVASPEIEAPQLVGRDVERAVVAEAVAAASAGSGRVVIVEGDAGIGKTALAEFAAATGRQLGVRVIWTRAIDGPGTPPLWMWEQVLGSLSATTGASGADELRGITAAVTATATATAIEPGLDPERARFRLSESLVSRVVDASRRHPLLLVFDDVQWADDSTLYTLRMLAQAVKTRPVSVVVTARTGSTRSRNAAATLQAVAREDVASLLEVHPLSVDEVDRLLDTLELERPGGAVALHSKSGGNPFYLRELLRAGSVAGVPTTIAGLVQRRLTDIPSASRAVIELAAVGGRRLDLLVLADALGRTTVEVVAALDPTSTEGIVAADHDIRGWSFVHDLARDAVLERISPADVAGLHARLADAIERVHADDPDDHVDELAHHRFEAVLGSPSRQAFEACMAAADLASQRLAHDQAAAQRLRALATLEPGAERRRERFEVLMLLTTERRLSGDVVSAASSLSQAIELAKRLDDRELLIRAVTVLGGVTLWNWRQFGQVDRGTVELLEQLLDTSSADLQPVTRQRVELLGTLGVELYYDELQRERGETSAREAVELARTTGDVALLGRALNNFVIASWAPSRAEVRRRALDESLALAGSGLPLVTEVVALMHRAPLHLRRGAVAAFEEDLERAAWLAPRLGIPEIEAQVQSQRAGFALLRGDRESALEISARAYQQFLRTSLWGGEWIRLMPLVTDARMEGTLDALIPDLIATASEDSHRTLRWTAVLALAETGDLARARAMQSRWSLRTLPRREHWGSDFEWAQAAEISLLLGSPDAADAYTALLPFRDELVDAGTGLATWGPVADVLSRLALAMGDADTAAADAAHAVSVAARVRAGLGVSPWWPSAVR